MAVVKKICNKSRETQLRPRHFRTSGATPSNENHGIMGKAKE